MAWYIRAVKGGSDGRGANAEYLTLESAKMQIASTITNQKDKGRSIEIDSEGRVSIRDRGQMIDTIWIEDAHGFIVPLKP